MEKKDEGPLSDEEFNRRADECVDGISRLIQSLADEHGLTVDQVWEQFLDYMVQRASKLDPDGNPLPADYDPFKDPSHPMHGWNPRKDNEEPAYWAPAERQEDRFMKKIKLPAEKVCVLSTAHLSKKDVERLDAIQKMDAKHLPRIQPHQYGWLVYLPAMGKEEREDQLNELRKAGFGRGFVHLYEIALDQGFSILDFDSDGATVAELPRHDW